MWCYVIVSNYWMQRTESPECYHIKCLAFASRVVCGTHQLVGIPSSRAGWRSIECAWYLGGCWMQTKMDPTVGILRAIRSNRLRWLFACSDRDCSGTTISCQLLFRTNYLLCWLWAGHVFDCFDFDRVNFQLCTQSTLSPASVPYVVWVVMSFWVLDLVLRLWLKFDSFVGCCRSCKRDETTQKYSLKNIQYTFSVAVAFIHIWCHCFGAIANLTGWIMVILAVLWWYACQRINQFTYDWFQFVISRDIPIWKGFTLIDIEIYCILTLQISQIKCFVLNINSSLSSINKFDRDFVFLHSVVGVAYFIRSIFRLIIYVSH